MAMINCRVCRQPSLILTRLTDFLHVLVTQVLNSKWKRCLVLVLFVTITLCWLRTGGGGIRTDSYYTSWKPSQSVKAPKAKYFVHGASDDLYMYSAIANDRQPLNSDLNIVVTSLDATYTRFRCCVLLDNRTLYTTWAHEYFNYHTMDVHFLARILEYFDPGVYRAHQHVCSLPDTGHRASHVTLTSGAVCSSDISDYVPILYPPKVPGGIALCAKIAHSGGLDPEKFIEWVEVQRIQGVDKILMFDLGNPEPLTRVFKYYQDLGVLDLQPYELPGLPKGRTLLEKDKHTKQFHHDETLPVLECRQRMGGYTYVLSHDVDEFIIPRADVDLKTFLKEKMETYMDAAGFFFYAEFFIYNWGPTDTKEDLMVTRYRKATLPHWECTKYVYLPSRVLSSVTHDIYSHRPFTTYRLPPEDAVLHHYRQCPDDVWDTCLPETLIDHVMSRFTRKHRLYERVKEVRQATGIQPQWIIS